MRLSGTKTGAANQYRGLGDQLWDLGGARPTLDLNFAQSKDLTDATTGKNYVDHTRASSGTYVGSDGLIKTAVTNLLTHSEGFNITGGGNWSSFSVTIATGQPDPIGGNNAFKLSTTNPSGAYLLQDPASVAGNFASGYRRSIWAKVATGTAQVHILGRNDASNSLVTLTDQWQRFDREIVDGTFLDSFYAVDFRGSSDTTEIYVWGAQLEQSTTVGEYVKTTSTINSAPRFDHNPTTGESLGLLVEESRTNLVLQSEDFSTTWAPTDATVTTNSIAAPNGANTADTYTEGASGSPGVFQAVTGLTAATVYTGSLFIKRGNNDWYRLLFVDNSTFTNGARAWFNTVTGTFGTAENIGTGGGVATSVTPFGDSWWRISLSTSMGGSNTAFRFQINSATADGSATRVYGSVSYLWGAQLEAGSFPTSYIPTTTAAVTRAADVASISGSNFGAFRTNLLQYSEEFDQTYWSKTNAIIRPNTILSPVGTLSGSLIIASSTPGSHFVNKAFSISSESTLSCYAKAGGYNYIELNMYSSGTNQNRVVVNLTNGSVEVNTNSLSVNVNPVNNGWYRIAVTSSTGSFVTFGISADGSANDSFTGDGTSGIYLWGAQLEEGSTATDYIKSDVNFVSRASSATYYDANGVIQTAAVDEARTAAYLPDGNGNFVSAGPLLLEAAGTNLLLQSENFSTTWSQPNTTVSVDQIGAPDGTSTADKIVETAATAEHNVRQDIASQSAGTYTFSIFAKAGERSNLQFVATGVLGSYRANFDLANGVLGSVDTQPTASIEPYPNGWYRCIVTATSSTSGTLRAQWNIITSSTAARVESYAGDITKGLYLWGAQLEAGSFLTSYIPTTTSTATRAADVSTSAATTVFESDWYRQEEGTVFQTYIIPALANGTISSFDDTTPNNRWQQRFITSGQRYRLQASGVSLIDSVELGAPNVNTPNKIAQVLRAGDQRYSANGSLNSIAYTATTLPVVTQLQFGTGPGADVSGRILIGRLTYWPQRLPNETLQTITN